MITNERMKCACGWEGRTDELYSVQVFAGSQEEPPEYEDKCPCCDVPFDDLEYVPLCKMCDDVYVREDGDVCVLCTEDAKEVDRIRNNQRKLMDGLPGCYGGGFSEGE